MIKIDVHKCDGCGKCVNICPCDVIRIDENSKKAFLKYADECWYCGSCVIECPKGAITLVLPYLIR